MGYESKIFVMSRHEYVHATTKETVVYGMEIARFDLCKMGYDHFGGKSFRDLFKKKIDFPLYGISADDSETYYDCYGDHCKSATISEVIAWVEMFVAKNDWWRVPPFLAYLKSLRDTVGENIVLVHYGY